MRFKYRRFRIALMMFALGLAAVYMIRGLSVAWSEVPVNLPKIESKEEVLLVYPKNQSDMGVYGYVDRTEKILNGRDLSLYDTPEYVAICDYQSGKELTECLLKRDAARKFVFDHWKQQRRGYVQVGFPCTDCGPTDHIFIEPDKNGRWVFTITLETNGPLTTSRSVKARFRKPKSDSDWSLDGSSRALAFIGENGHEVAAF